MTTKSLSKEYLKQGLYWGIVGVSAFFSVPYWNIWSTIGTVISCILLTLVLDFIVDIIQIDNRLLAKLVASHNDSVDAIKQLKEKQ